MNRLVSYTLPSNYDDFYVISGSLSHIQRFIYDTTSQGALKNMRGRSFYLTLLTRAICDKLLHRLNLKYDAILYNSGGTFCIISPYKQNIESEMEEIVGQIKRVVADIICDDIVNICGVKASRHDLENNCADIFDKLFKSKHRAKFTPYNNSADYDSLFVANPQQKKKSYDYIGAGLSDTTAILVSPEKLPLNDCVCIDLSRLGTYFYLGKARKLANVTNDGAYLLLINDEPQPSGCKLPIFREYIAGNGTRANSFEHLFTDEESSHQSLAVLRMDVDNLGALLRSAMRKRNALSEYAALSRKLDAYFKGRINEMWNKSYSSSTVIIYAGGDDLFIVGEWETTMGFMRAIHSEFKQFFNDELMSVSAGISFVKPKFPIVRAAEMSGREEEVAKSFEYNGQQKNAISIFETPLRWDFEYRMVENYKESLLSLIQRGEVDKSFVKHILQISENISYVNGKITPIKYVWIAAYDLSRMAGRKKDSIGAKFIKQCVQDIMSGRTLDGKPIDSPYHSFQLITIAARLVEMTLWKTEKTNK
ncbi:MAG: hypothetical protein IJX68_00710 [Rikenellaceae bacterium]|nr:hypothetical protein [Rikenellaceae bacterium]